MIDFNTDSWYTLQELEQRFEIPRSFVRQLVKLGKAEMRVIDGLERYDADTIVPFYVHMCNIATQSAIRGRVAQKALSIDQYGRKVAQRRKRSPLVLKPPPYVDLDDIRSRLTAIYRRDVLGESIDLAPKQPTIPKLRRLLQPIYRRGS